MRNVRMALAALSTGLVFTVASFLALYVAVYVSEDISVIRLLADAVRVFGAFSG